MYYYKIKLIYSYYTQITIILNKFLEVIPLKVEIRKILKQLDEDKINVKKAIGEIKGLGLRPEPTGPRATKIKIHIRDKSEGVNMRIPAIPFWFINSMVSLGFGLGSIVARYSNNENMEEMKMILDNISSRDIKAIINELRNYGPFNMVEIQDGSDNEVSIKVL